MHTYAQNDISSCNIRIGQPSESSSWENSSSPSSPPFCTKRMQTLGIVEGAASVFPGDVSAPSFGPDSRRGRRWNAGLNCYLGLHLRLRPFSWDLHSRLIFLPLPISLPPFPVSSTPVLRSYVRLVLKGVMEKGLRHQRQQREGSVEDAKEAEVLAWCLD